MCLYVGLYDERAIPALNQMNKILIYNSDLKMIRDFSAPKHLDILIDLHRTHSCFALHSAKQLQHNLILYTKRHFQKTSLYI